MKATGARFDKGSNHVRRPQIGPWKSLSTTSLKNILLVLATVFANMAFRLIIHMIVLLNQRQVMIPIVHGYGVLTQIEVPLYLYLQEVRLTAHSSVFFGGQSGSPCVVCMFNNL